jgi:hypothetical protein
MDAGFRTTDGPVVTEDQKAGLKTYTGLQESS